MRVENRAGDRSIAKAVRLLVLAILACAAAAGLTAPVWAQSGCGWYGTRPFCDGQCPSGFVYTGQRESCTTGSRRFCCPASYITKGKNCQWTGKPGRMLWVCDDPKPQVLTFRLKNDCYKGVDVTIEYKPLNATTFKTNHYSFKGGEVANLVDTKNRYIYVTAKAANGSTTWARQRIDMGNQLGRTHTHTLTCK